MRDELLVIVGPTAAGKTALGVALAEQYGGEVVSADAFAVYHGLDIGTAKPDRAVRARIPHHLIDIADPHSRYSAGNFVRDADAAIAGIRERAKLPIVVGGTLFYVRALLHGLFPEPVRNLELRERLERWWATSPDEVRSRLAEVDPESHARIPARDRQRTLRALEVFLLAGRPMSELWREEPRVGPRYEFMMLGVNRRRAELHARITSRVGRMFAAGLVAEVAGLLANGVRPEAHAFKAIGYREACLVAQGRWSEAEAQAATIAATKQLAKRQMTWLRGEVGVEWLAEEDPFTSARIRLEAAGGAGARP